MTKKEAAALFGNQARLAEALCISDSAISQWPVELTQDQQDRVIGAALRLGRLSPEEAQGYRATEAA